MTFFMVFPILLHLLLSGFKKYPFDTRLALYLSPLVFMTFSYGLFQLYALSGKLLKAKWPAMTVIVIILAFFPFNMAKNFPIEIDGIRESIGYINNNFSEGQRVYINYNSRWPYLYYWKTGRVKFADAAVRTNYKKDDERWKTDLNAVKKLDGEVWLLFSHLFYGDDKEHQLTVAELKKTGQLKRSFHSKISAAYLFDFTDGLHH
jgi:hypothetical protein